MSTIYDPPIAIEPGQAPPGQWPGPGGPWYPASPPGRSRRPLRHALAAVAVGVVRPALWSACGLAAPASGSATMTAVQIAAKVDPGLVDVVSTMATRGAKGAAPGWC